MEEDRLLSQLKEGLKGDFQPVKPLMIGWKRALWIIPLSMLFIQIILLVFHLRLDHAVLGAWALWGFCSLQILSCYLIYAIALEVGIPGGGKNPTVLLGLSLLGLAAYVIAAVFTFRISPNWSDPGHELSSGFGCMSVIFIFGTLALLFGFYMARFGLPIRARSAGLLFGLGSGIAAEASWRIHCHISSYGHVFLFHTGGIMLLALLGMAGGMLWKYKVSGK